jgi:hypothetical protein
MAGLILSGTGASGSQTFQFPDVRVGADQRPWSVPPDRGPYHYFRAGLLQFGLVGPGLFDTLPSGRPFQTVPQALIAAGCIVTSTPTTLGQTLTITDVGGSQIEVWTVQNVAEVPFGRMIPLWRGSAFTAAAFSSPFQIAASGFQSSDVWSLTIPALIRGDF